MHQCLGRHVGPTREVKARQGAMSFVRCLLLVCALLGAARAADSGTAENMDSVLRQTYGDAAADAAKAKAGAGAEASADEAAKAKAPKAKWTSKFAKRASKLAKAPIELAGKAAKVPIELAGKAAKLPGKLAGEVGKAAKVPIKLAGKAAKVPIKLVGKAAKLPGKLAGEVGKAAMVPIKLAGEVGKLPGKLAGEAGQKAAKFITSQTATLERGWTAVRPWSFSATVSPVFLGTALAFQIEDKFNLNTFVLSLVTTLGVHAAGNLMNTYFDHKNGVDKPGATSDTTLVDGKMQPREVCDRAHPQGVVARPTGACGNDMKRPETTGSPCYASSMFGFCPDSHRRALHTSCSRHHRPLAALPTTGAMSQRRFDPPHGPARSQVAVLVAN